LDGRSALGGGEYGGDAAPLWLVEWERMLRTGEAEALRERVRPIGEVGEGCRSCDGSMLSMRRD
jgi:hypothetical protein